MARESLDLGDKLIFFGKSSGVTVLLYELGLTGGAFKGCATTCTGGKSN